MADKIKYDKRTQLDDHIAKDPKKPAVLVVLSPWSPWAGTLAHDIEAYKKNGKVPIFVVEQDGEGNNLQKDFGITSNPAMMVFYNGQPVTIRVWGRDDDNKLVGSITTKMFKSLMEAVADVENEPILNVEMQTM